MLKRLIAQDPTLSAILITALVMIPALFAFAVVGWLGVGLLGLVGLMIAVRFDMTEDAPAGDVTRQRYVYEAQVRERPQRNPLQVAAEARSREHLLRVLYTIFGTLAVAGMGLGALTFL